MLRAGKPECGHVADMSKQTSTNCILCDKEVEGMLQLHRNSVNYMDDNVITHSCRTPAWYEARSNKAKSSKVERAVERLISHPRDKRAIQTLTEFRSQKLLELASKPNAQGLAAANKLMREYIGEPEYTRPTPTEVWVEVEEIPEAITSRLKDIPVEMIESKPVSKPASKAVAVSEPSEAVSEPADEPRPPDWERPIQMRNGQPMLKQLNIQVMSHNGKLMVVEPGYRLRQKGPYG